MTKKHIASFLRLGLLLALLAGMIFQPQSSVHALTTLTVQPITWNIIGLDSNNVNVGPNHFPVGARVCNTGSEAATNVTATWNWVGGTPAYMALRAGTLTSINLGTLTAGACADAYFEVAVTRNSAAYDTTGSYRIDVMAGNVTGTISTPTPRVLYIEHLISQNRNAVTDVRFGTSLAGLTSVAAGGTMNLMVGNTYYIQLVGATATQGYEQIESFINIPNTIFQVIGVTASHSAKPIPDTDPNATTKLYANGCNWENNPNSPNYRSCLGTGKYGGNITITYQVKILQVPTGSLNNPLPLSTLIYDFSGSSFHYNADYGVSTRFANIINASITKSFSPKTIQPGGTSTLTFTINNPGSSPISNVNFTDSLPANLNLANANVVYSGCGTPSPTSGTLVNPLNFNNITIVGNSTCTITVTVTSNTNGTYNNTTSTLKIDTTDTGSTASDTLVVSSSPAPPTSCTTRTEMARWTFENYSANVGTLQTGPFNASSTILGVTPTGTYVASGSSESAIGNSATVPAAWTTPTNTNTSTVWGIRQSWLNADPADTANPTSPFFQFQVNTGGLYGGVQITLDYDLVSSAGWNNSGPWRILYSTTGTAGSWSVLNTGAWAKSVWQTIAATSTSNTANVYFRLYFTGASTSQNANANAFIDNVIISGCPNPPPPTISKSFSSNPLSVGSTNTLTFTIANTTAGASALTGISFTDVLPGGILIAATPNLTNTCGGTATATANTSTISLSGGSLAAASTCTISVSVRGVTAGSYTNTSTNISSTQSGVNTSTTANVGFAQAALTVIAPPVINKAFTANPIFTNTTTLLTFSINNPNTATALTNLSFTDNLPAGLVVDTTTTAPATPPTNSCGGTLTATDGATSITLGGVNSLAVGATCTISVRVRGTTAGLKSNSVQVSSSNGGTNNNTATADVLVKTPAPAIDLLKQVGTTASGPWTSFLTATVGSNVYYKLTVENIGDVTLNNVSVTDPTVSTAGCSWTRGDSATPVTSPFTLPVADASNNQIATCILGPITAVSGSNTNTATASGTNGSTVTENSSATYGTPALTLVKSVTQTSFSAAGNILNYSYLVTNSGFAPLLGPVTVTDNKATVTCPAVSTVGDFDNYLDPGENITCTASYTVVAGDVTAGSVTNIATATVNSVNSNQDSRTVYYIPDFTVSKTNNVSGTVPQNGSFNWTISVSQTSTGQGSFSDTQTILSDTLPGVAGYYPQGALTVTPGGTPPTGTINCSITGTALSCVASGTVTFPTGSSFSITFLVTPTAAGTLSNTATVDPNAVVTETNEANNASNNIVTVVAPPSIAKVFSPNPIGVGGVSTLTFTITNPNTGTALTGVAFTDTFLAELQVAATPNATTTGCGAPTFAPAAGNTSLNFSGGTIAASGTCTVTVDVTATTGGAKLNTTGNVTSTNGGTGNTGTDTLTVVTPPTITKSFDVTDLASGGNTNLTVTIGNANAGAITLTSALTDTFPTGMTINTPGTTGSCTGVTATAGAGSFTIANGTSIPAGGCTVIVNVTSSTAGTATNTIPAGALQTTAGNNANPATSTLNVYVPPTVTKAFNPTSIASGGTSVLTLTVTNPAENPGALTSIQLPDTFPAGITLVNTTFTFTPVACGTVTNIAGGASAAGDNNARLNVASLAAGASCAVDVNVTSSTAGAALNTTDAVTATGPVALTGGTANDTLTVGSSADLSITKTDGVTSATPGGLTIYTIVVSNSGPSNVTGATVTDTFPAAITSATWTCAGSGGGTCTALGTGNINGTVSIPVGGSVTYTVNATISAAATGSLVNTATVTIPAGMTDPTPGNNTATDTDTLTQLADLIVSKTNNVGSIVAAGSPFNWTIDVNNTGVGAGVFGLGNVLLSDSLPGVAGYYPQGAVTVTNGGIAPVGTISCSIAGTTLTCIANTLVTMPIGASFSVTFAVTPTAAGTLANTVTVDPNGNVIELNETNNTGSDTVNVISVEKTIVSTSESSSGFVSGFERVLIGEVIRYRLTTYLPEGTWTNVQITDAIDPGIQFLDDGTATVSYTCNGSCTNSIFTTTGGPFSSSTDPTFNLGTVTNPDSDADAEYLVVEFNALVLNMTSNAAGGATRNNNYTISFDGATATSPNIGVRIAEPAITNLTKTVSVGPYYPGSTITYTLTYFNGATGVNRATAFDVFTTDTLSANLNLQSVSVTAPTGSTVTNTSTIGVGGIVRVLVDQVPPLVDIASGPTNVTITVVAQIVNTAPAGTLSNTADLTFTSQPGGVTSGDANGTCANVTGSCTPGTSGSTTGERNGTGGVPNVYNDTSTADIIVTPSADLSVTKTDGVTSVNAGGTTTYTVRVTNNGPSSVTGAILSDPAVAGLSKTGVTCSGTPGQCVTPPTVLELEGGAFALPALTSGEFYEISVIADVTASSGSVTNTATTAPPAGTTDPTPGNNTASDTDTVTTPPAFSKNFSPDTILTSQVSTLTFTIDNTANVIAATSLDFTDNLPAGVVVANPANGSTTCTGGIITATVGSGVISYSSGTVAAGASCTVQVDVTSASSGIYDNTTGDLTSSLGNSGPANDTLTVNEPENPVIGAAKDMNATGTGPWTVTIDYVFENFGNVTLNNLTSADNLSTVFGTVGVDWSFTSISSVPAAFANPSYNGSMVTELINQAPTRSLAVGGTASISVTITVNTPGIYNNQVTVFGDSPLGMTVSDDSTDGTDPDPNGDDTPDEDTPTPLTLDFADLSLTKTVDNSTPLVASNITFTITVTNANTSTIPATNVVVSDVIPGGFSYVSDNPSQGTYNSGTGNWSVGTLAIGASASLDITVSVNVTGPYMNYAEITGVDQVDPDSTPGNNSTTEDDDDSVTVTPTQNNPSGLTKSISNSNQAFTTNPNVAIGEIVEYTVNVNIPPGVFPNSQMVDTMQRGLSFMTCSNITPSNAALTTDVAGSFASACSTPTVDDAGGGTTVDVGRRVTFDLGTLTNASGADQTLTFVYTAVVLDSAANVSGVTLNNSAAWSSDTGTLPSASASVQIVEPELSISKTANTSLVSVGSEVTITLTIQHTGNSETNAYDTVVTDVLPAEMQYVPGSLNCTPGAQDPDVTCGESGGTVTAEWSNFTLGGGNGQVTFRVTVVSLPSSGISNVANVAWSSLPGPVSAQNSNVFSTERDYDPASNVDVYGASDTLVIGVFNTRLPATGFAPNVVTDLGNVPSVVYQQTGGLTVEVPSLGINLPIVGVPLKNGAWDVSWLGNQAGWLDGSAFPTWSGNSVLTGHVYGSNGQPGPFVKLNTLKYGDKIVVHAYGQKYTYEVRTNTIVDPNNASVFAHEDKAWLTLVTCKEYDEKTNTYGKRVVVRAVLVAVGWE